MMASSVSRHSPPRLYQINYSRGGLPKLPIAQAWVSVEGIFGDKQRNRVLHGGLDRALCVFSFERIQALQQEGHTIQPGYTGENLTLTGFDWTQLTPGNQLKIGEEVLIEFTNYCDPCRYTARWFLGKDYQRISQQHHPGWSRLYARVLSEGQIHQGDRVWIERLAGKV